MDLDADGFGHAVYRVTIGARCYSLLAFSQALDPERRTDRVIAEAWDASFVLFDGMPTDDDIARLARAAPRQEAARYRPTELVLSRANKSIRFFDHLVERLSSGQQPDAELLRRVGYLMRTTAIYGNGKFGIADRARIADRPELAGPFQAEMLTIYLIRCFTHDLVEHVARRRGGAGFAPLERRLKRYIGIGNATGLGMAPFLASHPILIHNWISARETALARVRSVTTADPDRMERFRGLVDRATRHIREWRVDDARQSQRITRLHEDLAWLGCLLVDGEVALTGSQPWDRLYRAAESRCSVEGQELIVSLLIELYPELVDELTQTMSSGAETCFEPGMRIDELHRHLRTRYAWALALDLEDPDQRQLFWYVSEEKLEPRLGNRFTEPGSEREMPLAIAVGIQALDRALIATAGEERVAEFLLHHPEFRSTVRRVQTVARYPYGEIYDNLVSGACLPIDLLRCKLSFFGASKFDPKSDRWTRITLYQGAPLPDELGRPGADDWCFPFLESM
ncbi:MAG TPA: hypothetical protein VED46_17905 [Alphaproteobacteria bacterium]|nr:hypothetical protein [Alphaproteobacteria bacterium]